MLGPNEDQVLGTLVTCQSISVAMFTWPKFDVITSNFHKIPTRSHKITSNYTVLTLIGTHTCIYLGGMTMYRA